MEYREQGGEGGKGEALETESSMAWVPRETVVEQWSGGRSA